LHSYFSLKKGTLYFDVNYQLNVREEFDKHKARNDSIAKLNLPALKLWIQSIAGELRWEHHVKKWQSQVGAQFSTQTNTYKYGYLIPAYWNFSGGACMLSSDGRIAKQKWSLGATA
jgi:iron complex outermembrane receptor protein